MDAATADSADCLARLAAGSDAGAWASLVGSHAEAMYRAAYAILGDGHAAEDAVQEALLHVRRSAGRFRVRGDPETSARSWLLRITANCAIDLHRARRHRPQALPAEAAMTSHEVDPAHASIDLEQHQLVHAALGDLSEPDRRALVLHYFGGCGHQALADGLGCRPGAARMRLSRALDRMRDACLSRGCSLGVAGVASLLGSAAASAADVVVPAQRLAAWSTLPPDGAATILTTSAALGGMSIMTKLALACTATLIFGVSSVTVLRAVEAAPAPS